MRTPGILKNTVGLPNLAKSILYAIEALQADRFFKEALGRSKIPGSGKMRQRLDTKAGAA
jgi:hypothetical protein